jgi:4-amino-4-deoxy-L-arabinose transferase-like glycosyltransferase
MEKMTSEDGAESRLAWPVLSEKKKELLYWGGALILTLAIRLYLLAHYYIINGDGIRYVTAGRNFWEGRWVDGLGSFYPPFFPLLIAAAYPLTGDWEWAGRLWPFLLGILILLPLFAVLRRIYGAKVAVAALLFYAVSPYLARFSVDVRSEVPYTFFFLLSVYFFLRGLDSANLAPFFVMGLTAALAYLVRPEGIGLIMVAVAFLFYRLWTRRASNRAYLQATVLCLGFALFAAPYVCYLRWDTGSWTISRKAANALSIGITHHDKSLESVRREKSDQVSAVDLALSRPLVFAKKVFVDAFRTLDAYAVALHYPTVPFLLIGWYLFFRSRFWEEKDFPLIVLIAFYFAVFSIFYPSRRFTMPLVPISLGWVALGFLSFQKFCLSKWPSRTGSVWVGLVLVLFCATTLPKTLKAIDKDKSYVRDAALYLKEKPGHPTILSNNPQVAYYAEGQNRTNHVRTELILDELAKERPDYLALDQEAFETAEGPLTRQGWSLERKFLGSRDGIYIFH